jgi:BRCA1-associated protein
VHVHVWCGVVGCGRYCSSHAERHFEDSGHPFSLELATQRIWDYGTGSYIHRDDLLNCPFLQRLLGAVNRAAYQGAAFCSQGGEFGGISAKKSLMIGEEYEVLLQSALEDQAQYFEGEIAHLQAELATDALNKGTLTPAESLEIETLEREIARVRTDVDSASRNLVEEKGKEAGHRAKANTLLREQGVMKKLFEKVCHETQSEQNVGKERIEELEQQVSDLTSNLRMRQQFAANQELNEAQIYGTAELQKDERPRKGFRKSRKR